MTDIEDVAKRNEGRLLSLPNVVGVGIGEKKGSPVIKVLVTRKVPVSELKPEEVVPQALEGYATDVQEIGMPQAQEELGGEEGDLR